MFSSVLLPEPDGPITAQNSPRCEREVDAVQHLGLDRRADVVGLAHAAQLHATALTAAWTRSATDRHHRVEPRRAQRRREGRHQAGRAWPAAARRRTAPGSKRQREHRRAVGIAREALPEQQRQRADARSRPASRPGRAARPGAGTRAGSARARCPSRAGCRSRATSAPPTPPARWRCRRPPTAPTKKRIAVLAVVCALTAVKNCALVLIQLSASTPVAAVMRWAMRLGGVDVAHRHVEAGHAAGQAEQALRGVQRDVGACAGWRPCCRGRRCR